jgi:hypothetical protein
MYHANTFIGDLQSRTCGVEHAKVLRGLSMSEDPHKQTNGLEDEFDLFWVRGRLALAICARDRRFRAAAAQRYPLYSTRRRIFRRLTQTAIALHLDKLWSRRGRLPESLIGDTDLKTWLRSMRETLGRQDIFPVLHGPPQIGRKRVYAHLLDEKGQAVAFAKLAFDDLNNTQLEQEIRMLSLVQSGAPQRFKTPKVLEHGIFEGNRYILYEPLPRTMAPVNLRWESLRPAVTEIAGNLQLLDRDAMIRSDWWKQLETLSGVTPQFMRDLDSLMVGELPVCRVHGDLGVNNLIVSDGILWIVDWEHSSESAPHRTDEISYFLSTHVREDVTNPRHAISIFEQHFLNGESSENWRDALAGLAFLAAHGRASARTMLSRWVLSYPVPLPT